MSLDKNNPNFLEYNRMFVDLWGLFKKYYSPKFGNPEEEDAWWESFISEVSDFREKYKRFPLAGPLVMCIHQEMERKYRENKEEK